jgi:hypothetical protein
MAHEQLPQLPDIDLPREVAEDLIRDGHAESAPNIHAFSAVPDYLQGILFVTGAASRGITIVEALNGGLRRLVGGCAAGRERIRLRAVGMTSPDSVWRSLEPAREAVILNLNADPTEEQLEAYLVVA